MMKWIPLALSALKFTAIAGVGAGLMWLALHYANLEIRDKSISVRSKQIERTQGYVERARKKQQRDDKRRQRAKESVAKDWVEKPADPELARFLDKLWP